MKKILLLCSAVSMLFMTSCLDNNDSSISGSNQFTVVQVNTSGTKYIAVPQATIQGTELTSYESGDALIMSAYKANTGSANSQGILSSDYITIETSYPNKIQKTVLNQTADTTTNITNQIGLKSLSIVTSSIRSAYLDRSLFTYSISLSDGETASLAFYYDEDKQFDRQGVALSTNRAVLDIVVTITGDGIGEKQDKVERVVLNATDLRTKLTPTSFSSSYVNKIIDLRYSKYNTTTKKYSQEYLASQLGFTYYSSSN